jgi:hypothetical protein
MLGSATLLALSCTDGTGAPQPTAAVPTQTEPMSARPMPMMDAAMATAGSAARPRGGASAADSAGTRSSPLSAGAVGSATAASGSAGTSAQSNVAGARVAGVGGSQGGAGTVSSSEPSELMEHSGSDCGSSAGALTQNPKLPNPFEMHDGSPLRSRSDWRCRRDEIKQDIETYEIGPKPERPTVEASVSGGKLNVVVTTSAGSIMLSSTVTAAAGSECVAIGMNTASSLVTGCLQVPFMHDQVVKYANDSSQLQSDPFYKLYPELWGKVGNYAAWSWGISRLIDGLIQVQGELGIDPRKVAVHGCSYAGKMALFAGAFDERIALTIAQESGGGGINAWRASQDFTKRTGTNIEKIDNTSAAWFLASMKQLDPYSLPHDHHELIAMIAPRAVVALGNQDYEWLGDESGWKSINAAKEVWKALGVEDHIGFDFTSNHPHCSAPAGQVASAKAFVDKFLKGQNVDTAIVIEPEEGDFDLDFRKSIDWQTPTLQ